MKRVDSVISLIYSLSKSEKKHFSLQVVKDKEEKDYLVIYDIITKSKQPNGNTVKEEFYKRRPRGSFEVSIQLLSSITGDSNCAFVTPPEKVSLSSKPLAQERHLL